MKIIKASLMAAAIMMSATTSFTASAGSYYYVYASTVDGFKMCSSSSPGPGWYKYSPVGYTSLGACNYYGR